MDNESAVTQTGLASASTVAGGMDALYWVLTANAVFFTVLIFAGIIFLAVRYRRGAKVDRSRPPQYNHIVEALWTLIPLAIAMGIFVWSTVVYFRAMRVPKGAMEINVVGKQWMWKIQHPSGKWENNELHVPAGRPVLLTLTSEDVIHSFYVPAFRLKQDAIPGTFTRMWFEATKPGRYHLLCAEFCGTLHSTMVGTVYVMEPAEYDRWLTEGSPQETVAAEGQRLFRMHGCSSCHSGNGSVRAPTLEGIYGRAIPVQIPKPGTPLERTPATTMVADTRYLHDAIVLPLKEIAAGYLPVMPTFKDRLTEEEILKLIAYIRSLGRKQPEPPARPEHTRELTEEDYKARTGFVPKEIESMRRLQSGAAGQSGEAGR